MLTFTAVFGGFVYFNFTKRDYTYEGLRESMITKRVNKYLKREGVYIVPSSSQGAYEMTVFYLII